MMSKLEITSKNGGLCTNRFRLQPVSAGRASFYVSRRLAIYLGSVAPINYNNAFFSIKGPSTKFAQSFHFHEFFGLLRRSS